MLEWKRCLIERNYDVKKEEIRADLSQIRMLFQEPLSKYTFTETGGPADVLVFPKNKEEVKEVVTYCLEQGHPWLVLGNASNLIVRDGGISGFVIMLTDMKKIVVEGTDLVVEAGAKLIDTSYKAAENQLTGLEFACGIPGSVGGAIYMNAGAYDGEIRETFESAEVILEDGTIRTFRRDEMNFGYRHSVMQERKAIVLSVRFQLKTGDSEAIKTKMAELTELRESKQPLEYPSCGSVFKRPIGHFTGKLIQDAGMQGLVWGGAQISEKHAGFIVNINHATATDYTELIAHIQEVIFEKYQVKLETEVRVIGNDKA